MLHEALEFAKASRDAALADLVEELRIPSVSTLPEHRADCRRNAEWLVDRFADLGFETQLVDVVPDGHPVLRADWIGHTDAPTLTIYGHYDVQPPDPLDEWTSDPFDPVVHDEVLFARGCADNKGNHMSALKAAECWMQAGSPPVNLRFLIEGEEEIGGSSLPTYLRQNASELSTDSVLLWDGGFATDGSPSLCAGLRGMLYVEIEVAGSARDLHSGFGGAAPNAAFELARILAALKDDKERITVPGFYDDVRDPDPDEVARWHRMSDDELKALFGTETLVGEAGYDTNERLRTRPTLELNGVVGGFTGAGMKTVIPAKATAKVSMRLVPDQDPNAILKALEQHVAELANPWVRAKVTKLESTPPVLCGYDHSAAQAATKAFADAFGRPAVLVRSGGSIPVATAFSEAIGAPMVVSGIATMDSGAHGPNERLYLGNFYGGIEMLIRFMQELADAGR